MKNKKFSYMLMIAHFCNDVNQGALPAILPFLIIQQNLSYTLAASLIFIANLVSSLAQPFVGYLGDRSSKPWFMPLGIFLSALGISLIGFCNNYLSICFCVGISGLGSALFHPEGGKLANFVAGDQKGAGVSLFGVGGNLGFAFGPLMAAFFLSIFSLKATIIFIIPALIMAFILLKHNKDFLRFEQVRNRCADIYEQKDDWLAFIKISLIIFSRSIVQFALLIFIPLFFINIFFYSEAKANLNLTLFSLFGAIATLIGGKLADLYGFNKVVKFSAFGVVLALFLLLQVKFALYATFFIVLIAIFINSSYSPLVVLSQNAVPNHVGFASGISLGLSVSVGGMFAPLFGYIADIKGLFFAFYAILFVSLVTASLTFFIKDK